MVLPTSVDFLDKKIALTLKNQIFFILSKGTQGETT